MRGGPLRWSRVIVAILAFIAPAKSLVAVAQTALVYETVEPSRIRLGESATIRVMSFDDHLKDVALPTVPGLTFELVGRSRGFDFVNGSPIPANWIQIRVTAQFAGVFTIPPLIPNSHSLGLQVIGADEPDPLAWRNQIPPPLPVKPIALPKGVELTAGGAAFVQLVIPTHDLYVGESVPIDIELGIRPGIVTSINGLPTLSGSDFTLNNLSKQPIHRDQVIEGSPFLIMTWHSVLAAVKPGNFALSVDTPLSVKVSTPTDNAFAARLAWPFLQSMINSIVPKEMTVASPPSELKVLPLPTEGQPKDFSGAVGSFQVSSDITPAGAGVGEPLTLRLHVSGTGNFDRVDAAMLDHLDHWKTYPAKSTFTASDSSGHQGEKVFEQPLIAAQPGEQSIPGLEFSYFDPRTRHYERTQTPPIQVTIAASLGDRSLTAMAGLNGTSGGPFAAGLRPDHPASKRSVSELKPLYFQPPFLAVPATLALMLVGGWIAARPRVARGLTREAQRALTQMDVAARSTDSAAFFDIARTALLRTYAARWQISADQIGPAELKARLGSSTEEVERLFLLADETKYSAYKTHDQDYPYWLRLVRDHLTEGKQ